jgi:hypothetical protein
MWLVASTAREGKHGHHLRRVHHAVDELKKQILRAPVLGVANGHGELVRRRRWPLLHPSHIPDRVLAREHRICAAIAMCEGCHGQANCGSHRTVQRMGTAFQRALACLQSAVIFPRAQPPCKVARMHACAFANACMDGAGGSRGNVPLSHPLPEPRGIYPTVGLGTD